MLDQVPESPVVGDSPRFGTYAGRCENTDLRLSDRQISCYRQFVSEKRWQWFCGFDDTIAVGGAVVDAGFFGTVFLWVFDRSRGEMLVDDDIVVPSPLLSVTTTPTRGSVASVSLPGHRLTMGRVDDRFTVDGRFGSATLDLEIPVSDERAITAICPVSSRTDGVNITQKEATPTASGRVLIGRSHDQTEYSLDGVGFLDYSHGLLGRKTEWDWAFGRCTAPDETTVAFNLVGKFNDGLENVVWIDGTPESVGTLTLEPTEENAWHARTACETVDMVLSVEGTRNNDLNIGVLRSSYTQPLGTWEGTVAGYDVAGVGVAEEHLTHW